MKKIFLLFVFTLMILVLNAQESESISRTKILAVGMAELSDSVCKVQLEIPSDNYYVLLTPIDNYAQLYITGKSNNSFIVKSNSTQNAKFEYVIIERKIKFIESDYIDERKIK